MPKVYLEEKNTTKNIELFEKLISHNPKKLHYYKVLAELYRSVQQYDKAGYMLKKMVEFSPKLALDAVKLSANMLRLCPMNFPLRQLLINFLWKACNPEKAHIQIQELCRLDASYIPLAIKDYKNALRTFPNHKDLLIGISTLLIETQAYSESISYIEKIYENHPTSIKYVYSLLQIILDRCPNQFLAIKLMVTLSLNDKDIDQSLQLITQLIDGNSNDNEFIILTLSQIKSQFSQYTPLCHFLTAKLHFLTNEYRPCLALLKSLQNTEFEVDAIALEIQIQIKLNNISNAQQLSNNALQKHPHTAVLHSLFTDIQHEIINQQINTITIKSEKNHFEVGLLFLRKGDLYAALEKFQNISVNSSFNFKANILIGRCFLELGQYHNATKHISLCCQNDTSMAKKQYCQLLFFKAIIQINSGHYQAATETLSAILKIDTKRNVYLVVTLFRRREMEYNFIDVNGTTPATVPAVEHYDLTQEPFEAEPVLDTSIEEITINTAAGLVLRLHDVALTFCLTNAADEVSEGRASRLRPRLGRRCD